MTLDQILTQPLKQEPPKDKSKKQKKHYVVQDNSRTLGKIVPLTAFSNPPARLKSDMDLFLETAKVGEYGLRPGAGFAFSVGYIEPGTLRREEARHHAYITQSNRKGAYVRIGRKL